MTARPVLNLMAALLPMAAVPLAALVLALSGSPAAAQSADPLPNPAEHLGRPLGGDFTLADWDEVSGYHRALAAASPRVTVERIGESTEGRDYLVTVVTSEANHARLDELRALSRRLSDPRGLGAEEREDLLSRARPIVMVSPAMHSNETAGPQFAMDLAWRLASSDESPWARAREELVVVILPCTNPDGLDRIVHWYRQHVGTPYEATGLTELYQHYAGHDNNRDWFMLSLAETRLVSEQLYDVWRPQVYWDVHQQGSRSERLFVPPFRDPLDPNLDPGIMTAIDALGSRALLDLTAAGFTGVSTGVTYDMWWNGGNRNVPVRHNIIGLLTEAASVDIATPLFLPLDSLRAPSGLNEYAPSHRFPAPWPGGWWRLADIIEYERAFAASLFGSLAREPRHWLEVSLGAAERSLAAAATEVPTAWVIPADNRDGAAVRRLADVLLRTGVELHVATTGVRADGRTWPAGSIVIERAQPYGGHVKDLFEVQRYPEGDPPYDVAGWTLPLLMGVHRVEVVGEVEAGLRRVTDAAAATAGFPGDLTDSRHGDGWRDVFARLGAGSPLDVAAFANGPDAGDDDTGSLDRLPRIGVYSPWTTSMDEGWLRWVFDRWGVPFVTVRNETLRAGALDQWLDVLVIPDVRGRTLDDGRRAGTVPSPFAGGLDPEGAVAIDAFVRGGGKLVTLDDASDWAIDLFELPLRDVTGDGGFSCPGSVLRAMPEDTAFTGNLPSSLAVFFSRSAAWDVDGGSSGSSSGRGVGTDDLSVLLRYAPSRVLLSGWIQNPDVIEGRAAWVHASVGKGDVHLFAFRPHYRSWSEGTFQLLFRALLL